MKTTITAIILLLLCYSVSQAQQESLSEINRRLENPLTSLWSLTFQENFSILKGDQIDTEYANNFFFQPFLPIPIGSDFLFAARPVIPLVTNAILIPDSNNEIQRTGSKTGLGDIQLLSFLGPNRKDGIVWGAGATLKFPTATDDVLGEGKYQAGPAAMLFNMGKRWTVGLLAQHWWSYAGDSDRPKTNETNIQYVIRRQIPGAMSLGMGPTVAIDWEEDSGNQITLPVGLGLTKTVRIGKTPVKLRFEPQYSIIRPDDLGAEWNFRIQISPVIQSPFKRNN